MGSPVVLRLQGRRLRGRERPAKGRAMDAQTTAALLAGGLVLAAIGGLGGIARTRAPLAWHAHLPWNGFAFVGVAGALVAAVHLFNLLRAA